MSLSSISIRRPVLAIVMSIAVILFGVIGYTFLGVREFPNVDPPVITVSTSYILPDSNEKLKNLSLIENESIAK